MQRLPDPITPQIAELFDYMMQAAAMGRLGVISVFDKATGVTRYALAVRHIEPDQLFPIGFLSATAGEEVISPSEEPPLFFVLVPEQYEVFRAYGSDEPADIDRWADDGGAVYG